QRLQQRAGGIGLQRARIGDRQHGDRQRQEGLVGIELGFEHQLSAFGFGSGSPAASAGGSSTAISALPSSAGAAASTGLPVSTMVTGSIGSGTMSSASAGGGGVPAGRTGVVRGRSSCVSSARGSSATVPGEI